MAEQEKKEVYTVDTTPIDPAEERTVCGYLFSTKEDAVLARGERQKILILKEKVNLNDLKAVIMLYRKAIDQKAFVTPIGLNFLTELREYLLECDVEEAELMPIPVARIHGVAVEDKQSEEDRMVEKRAKERKEENRKSERVAYQKTRRNLAFSIVMNLVLVIMIFIMFAIAMSSNNPNVLNYKHNLQNQYSSWEQELKDREAVIREKELELKYGED